MVAKRGFIQFDGGRIKADIKAIKDRLGVAGQLHIKGATRGMTLLAEDLISQAQDRLEPQTRSGALRASGTVGDVRATATALENSFGFNKDYAAQRDLGGPVRPKKGRMLAIPLEPILTARGVPRFSSPREEPDLQLVVLAGKVFLVKKVMRRGQWARTDFHWLLVPRVDQEGSGYFSKTVKANAPRANQVIGEAVKAALAEGASGG